MPLFRTSLLFACLGMSGMAQSTQAPNTPAAVEAEARALLETLVGFRTVAGTDQVARMADDLTQRFRAAGFDAADIERVGDAQAPGLIVRFRGPANGTQAPVLFLAHMDVVDALPGEWASDPWVLTEKDGALYGRGVIDNKFGVLTIAQAFLRLKREGFVPDRDLVLAFSGDEETQMHSTQALAERLRGAAFAVNSDAGGGYRGANGKATYGYQAAEKTYATFTLNARGKGGHSSRPGTENTIYTLAGALQAIAAHRFPLRWNAITLESFGALLPTLPQAMATPLQAFIASPGRATAEAIIQVDPGFASELATTCVATMLRAGMVENALPTEATATVNCRVFPGETVADTQATLARLAGKQIDVALVEGTGVEGPTSSMPPEMRAALDAVLAVRAPGTSVSPYMEAGATDGVRFRRAGINTIGMGPQFATETSNYNFHGIDERLPLSEFREGLDHYYLFIKALAGPGQR